MWCLNIMMTQINVSIPDTEDEEFRAKVFERKGLRRGAISESFTEAVKLWTSMDYKEILKIIGDHS